MGMFLVFFLILERGVVYFSGKMPPLPLSEAGNSPSGARSAGEKEDIGEILTQLGQNLPKPHGLLPKGQGDRSSEKLNRTS
jgi:hypothetical protein